MTFQELIKNLTDMELLYGEKVILNVIDEKNKYSIKEIVGNQCARYFEPSDGVSEVTIIIKQNAILERAYNRGYYDAMENSSKEKLEKIEEIISDYDGSVPSMIKIFSEVQQILEKE